MLSIRNYSCPDTLEEAYQLAQGKKNAVLGGCGWLSQGNRRIQTAIDLKKLALDQISCMDGAIHIGAYATLHQIETHPLLREGWNGLLTAAVGPIVGVQFRNIATIGGSVFSRFGFSDINCALLALDACVETYRYGMVRMEDYLCLPREKDIVKGIIVTENTGAASCQSIRRSATDFPVLLAAAAKCTAGWRIAVGARPAGPCLAQQAMHTADAGANFDEVARIAANELTFGTNSRASADYRRAMCEVLVKRVMTASTGNE